MVSLLTCKICKKQYVGSSDTKLRRRFNEDKSNINLYGKGKRGFMQEILFERFFSNNHNGSLSDMKIQINDSCDLNTQKPREDFWTYHLNTNFPRGRNTWKL